MFIDKAVAGWTGKSDVDHAETIATYIRSCHNSNSIIYNQNDAIIGGLGDNDSSNNNISDNNAINKKPSSPSLMFNDDIKGYNVLQETKLQLSSAAKDPLYAIVATKQ